MAIRTPSDVRPSTPASDPLASRETASGAGNKPTAEQVAAGAAKADKATTARDMFAQNTLAGSVPASMASVITSTTTTAVAEPPIGELPPAALLSELQAFAQLAAQHLGDLPNGKRIAVAERFTASLGFADTAPLSTFVPGELFAAFKQATTPKQLARAEALTRLLSAPSLPVLQKKLSTLTAEQQAAVKQAGSMLQNLYKGRVSSTLSRPASPAERRDLKARAEASATAQSDVFAASAAASEVGNATLGPIELPHPLLTALEPQARSIVMSGMDIDSMVQLVLMESSQLEEKELMELVNEMKEQNRKMSKLREVISAQKQNQAAAKAELRQAYDRRTKLDENDPLHINPSVLSFEGFCSSQKLKVQGSMTTPTEELVRPEYDGRSPSYVLSPNTEHYASGHRDTPISTEDVAWARALSITPQQLSELRSTYEQSAQWRGLYPDFATFLGNEVGLLAPATDEAATTAKAQTWLASHSLSAERDRVGREYALRPAEVDALYDHFATHANSTQKAAGFEAWLTSAGVGIVKGGSAVANQGKVEAFFRREGVALEQAALMATYGITAADLAMLQEVHRQSEGVGSFEAWLQSGEGPGLVVGESNRARVRDYARREVAELQAEPRVTLADCGITSPTNIDELLSQIPSMDVAGLNALAVQLIAGIPGGTGLDDAIARFVEAMWMNVDNNAGTDMDSSRRALDALISALPEGVQQLAKTLVAVRLEQAAQESSKEWNSAEQAPFISGHGIGFRDYQWSASGWHNVLCARPGEDQFVDSDEQRRMAALTREMGMAATRSAREHGGAEASTRATKASARTEALQSYLAVLDAPVTYELAPLHRTTTIAETNEARAARQARESATQASADYLANLSAEGSDVSAAAGRVEGITEVTLDQVDARIEELEGLKETFSSLSEEKSLRLQMHMDRRAKLVQTLSNIMKKVSDVQSGIIGNLT